MNSVIYLKSTNSSDKLQPILNITMYWIFEPNACKLIEKRFTNLLAYKFLLMNLIHLIKDNLESILYANIDFNDAILMPVLDLFQLLPIS